MSPYDGLPDLPLAKILAISAIIGGDEDEDDDGADDAEMFRMDAKMAAYLRGMVDARQGAKERRAALCNLRLRALALIDTFAKKVRGSHGRWMGNEIVCYRERTY